MPDSLDAKDEERRIPEALGKYKIIQRLAVGGMAELFLARVTGLEGFEKYVVVKRILPHHAEDSHFVDMFLDEAKLAARLDHQNIVQVHDIGQDDGAYFFVMEYLHGEDVQGLLKAASKRNQPIPLEHDLTIVTGVAAGLQHAHEKRDTDGLPLHIVHRDVAPSNIIVTYDGGVKLVDFGIARAHFRRSQTEAGRVKGKLSYMSPEQCRGEELDARSDIFTLGIVTYELTTMSRLFRVRRSNKLEVMERIVKGDIPPPSKRVDDYPPELEKIVMRSLRVDMGERYQTAAELLHDLEEFARSKSLSLSSSALARYLRDTVGYRLEPWRVDRPEAAALDSGKIRRADDEARLSLPVGGPDSRNLIPTPSRPGRVVSGRIVTSEDTTPDMTSTTRRFRRGKNHKFIAILAALLAVFVAVLVIVQLSGETAPKSDDGKAPVEASTNDDELELEEDIVVPGDSAGSAGKGSRKRAAARSSRRKRGGDRSRKEKRSAKRRDARSERDDRSERERKSEKSAEKSTTATDKKKTKTETKTRPDAKPEKKPEQPKKWDPNSPFPPSENE